MFETLRSNEISSDDKIAAEVSFYLEISNTLRVLKGSNLSQGYGREFKRPIPKKQIGFNMVETLDRLIESNKKFNEN